MKVHMLDGTVHDVEARVIDGRIVATLHGPGPVVWLQPSSDRRTVLSSDFASKERERPLRAIRIESDEVAREVKLKRVDWVEWEIEE